MIYIRAAAEFKINSLYKKNIFSYFSCLFSVCLISLTSTTLHLLFLFHATNFSHPSVQTHTSWQTTLYPHCLVQCSTPTPPNPSSPRHTCPPCSENKPAPDSREALSLKMTKGLENKIPPVKPSRRGRRVLWLVVLIRGVISCHRFQVISL